jgi:hypothetical protein
MRHARLAPEVVQHGAEFGVEIRHLVEHSSQASQVIAMPAQMRRHELRLRMPLEQPIALRHQCLEGWIPIGRIRAIGEQRQLKPPLVAHVDRLEEFRRIGGVDEHGKVQACAGVPEGRQLRVIQFEPGSIRLA